MRSFVARLSFFLVVLSGAAGVQSEQRSSREAWVADREARRRAHERARTLGEGERPEVAGLRALLREGTAHERHRAAEELGRVARRAWQALSRQAGGGPSVPWEALPDLLEAARGSGGVGSRLEALESLGQLPTRSGLTLVVEALGSADEDEREAACAALSDVADFRWLRADLVGFGESPDLDKALEELRVLGEPSNVASLLAAYRSEFGWHWREELAAVLLFSGRPGLEAVFPLLLEPGADRELLARVLEDELDTRWPDLRLFQSVCCSEPHSPARKNLSDIARFRTRPVVRELLEELDAVSGPHRRLVVRLLGLAGARKATPRLLSLLDRAKDDAERHAIVAALGRLRDRRAVERLTRLLPHERVGWLAAEALAASGPGGLDVLVREATSGDAHRCETALWGLDAMDPADAQRLLPLVVHRDREVRSELLEALRRLRHPEIDRLLTRYLQDPDLELADMASWALMWSQQPEVGEAFVAISDSVEPRRRAIAARGVGWLDGAEATELLILLAHDEAAEVRAAAAEGLSGKEHGELPALSLRLLDDPAARVRAAAVGSLGKLALPSAVPRLLALLDDPDSVVRCSASESLGRAGEPRARDLVVQLAIDSPNEDGRCHWRAITAFGGVEELLCLLRHPQPGVREMAALFTWQIGDGRLTAALHQAFLDEQEPSTSHVLAQALVRQGVWRRP